MNNITLMTIMLSSTKDTIRSDYASYITYM